MRDKTTAGVLALLLGGLGIHRFYLGQPFIGLAYFLFCWTFIPAILGFIDGLYILVASRAWFDATYNKGIRRMI